MAVVPPRARVARGDQLSRLRTVGAVALAALNVLDLLTTRAALQRGAGEANPLAGFLLEGGWLDVTKIGMSVALLVIVTRTTGRVPSLVSVSAVWLATAVYAVVVAWNFTQLVALG